MKKVMSLLLAVMIALSLSACGNKDNSSDLSNDNSQTTSTEIQTNTSDEAGGSGGTNEPNSSDASNYTDNSNNFNSSNGSGDSSNNSYSSDTNNSNTANSSSNSNNTNSSNNSTTTTHTHKFSNATCTEPAKCSCGATKGSALSHSYNDATCTKPKTCTKCGSTSGNALGHKEVIDNAVSATCTKSGLSEGKHCSVCNTVIVAQEIIPATHQYTDATCTEPQKCKLCGSTYGTHNGHDFSRSNSCSSCGMWLSDIFDYEYYGGSYFVGDRNYTYGTAYITNCSKTYYKYNNSLTLVVSTKATISAVYPGTSGSVTYSVCLYKDGVLFDSKSCYVSGKKGTTGTDSVTFYNVTPGAYEIKIRN